jgi:hypothetical protein
MKKTLTTVAALVACAGTQLFAQNTKEDVITLSLTRYAQNSVSTSATTANAGLWTDPPTIYKTASSRFTTTDVLKAIAIVLHGNAGAYTSRAQLVLVQGELGGFFGYPYVAKLDDTSTVDGDNIRFATGRNSTNNPTSGALPPGHNQPWGQIFVKDSDSRGNVFLCENVSFFFAIQVQECYDCFYLNSFISDARFVFKEKNGPPCCAGSAVTSGDGKDKYYITFQFDNTLNNPYLNPDGEVYPAGTTNALTLEASAEFYDMVGGTGGLYPPSSNFHIVGLRERDDGVNPDGLPYTEAIKTGVKSPIDSHSYDIYTLRFSLNGIFAYNWTLKFVNKTDAFPDFVGGGSAAVSGYGYALKVCSFFSGTLGINEKVVASTKCCLDQPWFSPGSGADGGFWFGVGDFDKRADISVGDPGDIENYYDTASTTHLGDGVQINTDLDLTFHPNFNHNYEPIQEALRDVDYPQPGFEGIYDDLADPTVIIEDIQPPQGDGRAADGSID